MTDDRAFKKAVRAYAAEHQMSYTQARREMHLPLLRASADPWDGVARQALRLTINRARSADGERPFPLTIGEHGIVAWQDFWRGDPFRLVGFTETPDGHRIVLTCAQFLAETDDEPEPRDAVGLFPVFADRDGGYATFTDPVESVSVSLRDVVAPDLVRGWFRLVTPAGATLVITGVAHLLEHLTDEELVEIIDADSGTCPAAATLFDWLALTGNDQVAALVEARDAFNDDQVDLWAALTPGEVRAWLDDQSAKGLRRPW